MAHKLKEQVIYYKEKTGKEFFVVKDIYSMKEIVEYLYNIR